MPAPIGNQNGIGNSGGRPYSKENREKAATLKGLVIDWAIKIMEGKDEAKKKEVVLKILPTCIPQEHRHSGSEENELPIPILMTKENASHNSNNQDTESK